MTDRRHTDAERPRDGARPVGRDVERAMVSPGGLRARPADAPAKPKRDADGK